MAVRLAARLRAALGVRATAAVIFEQPNIAALAAKLLDDLGLSSGQPENGETNLHFDGSDEDALRLISDKYEEIA
jgi:hypothetical protein